MTRTTSTWSVSGVGVMNVYYYAPASLLFRLSPHMFACHTT